MINYKENKYKHGIYMFTNLLDGKVYIGSATIIDGRRNEHYCLLRKNKHHCVYFQNAWNLHGPKNFKHEILEVVEDENQLIPREQFYLDQRFAQEFIASKGKDRRFRELCYNIEAIAGGSRLGIPHTEESKKKMSIAKMGKSFHTPESIAQMITTKIENGTNKLSEETKKKIGQAHLGKPKSEEHRLKIREIKAATRKPILQYDMQGNFIKEYRSVTECRNELVKATNIPLEHWAVSSVCKNKIKYCHGFVFRYKQSEDFPKKIEVNTSPIYSQEGKQRQIEASRKRAAKVSKAVLVYNKDTGEFIREYPSLRKTALDLQLDFSRVGLAVRNKIKFTSNYIFRYKTSDDFPKQIAPITTYYKSEQALENVKNIGKKNSKPILCYDLNDKFIKEYSNAVEAAKELNLLSSGIRLVLHGKCKQTKGYKFTYKKGYEKKTYNKQKFVE